MSLAPRIDLIHNSCSINLCWVSNNLTQMLFLLWRLCSFPLCLIMAEQKVTSFLCASISVSCPGSQIYIFRAIAIYWFGSGAQVPWEQEQNLIYIYFSIPSGVQYSPWNEGRLNQGLLNWIIEQTSLWWEINKQKNQPLMIQCRSTCHLQTKSPAPSDGWGWGCTNMGRQGPKWSMLEIEENNRMGKTSGSLQKN